MVFYQDRYNVTMTPHTHNFMSSPCVSKPSLDCILKKNTIMKGHGTPCWKAIGGELNMNGAFGLPQLNKKDYEKVLEFCGPIQGSVYTSGGYWNVYHHYE